MLDFLDRAAPYVTLLVSGVTAWVFRMVTDGRREREKLTDDFHSFKLTVAKEYVTVAGLREIEDRLVAAIERLGDRLDRILDRAGGNK